MIIRLFCSKKPTVVNFSVNNTKLEVSWDGKGLCGQALAIFVEDEKTPKKVLTGEDLVSGKTEIEVGACRVIRKDDLGKA